MLLSCFSYNTSFLPGLPKVPLNLINVPGRKQFLSSIAQTNMTKHLIFIALSHTVWRLSSVSYLHITPTCCRDTWIRFLIHCTKLPLLTYNHLLSSTSITYFCSIAKNNNDKKPANNAFTI